MKEEWDGSDLTPIHVDYNDPETLLGISPREYRGRVLTEMQKMCLHIWPDGRYAFVAGVCEICRAPHSAN